MSTISLQKKQIDRSGGVVVLTLEEYERLREHSIPTYYLRGEKARLLDSAVDFALREYRNGKTRKIRTLADIS